MRLSGLAVLAALLCAIAPGSAAAAEIPPYDGTSFPTLHGPTDPEDYSWGVQLDEGQTLEQVDDKLAIVRWESGVAAFQILAGAAHDATGAAVPTTLAVTQPNVVTVTVHHRAGNSAAAGAPFTYPISAGPGWEDVSTVSVQLPSQPPPAAAPPPPCLVPKLAGRSLRASRKVLRRSGCKLGPVRGDRRRGARVAKQYLKPGRSLPAGSAVGVKLG